jgi:hypothetical protein
MNTAANEASPTPEEKSLANQILNLKSPLWIEAEENQTGLMTALDVALKAVGSCSTIWSELEDFTGAEDVLHFILQVISIRHGFFQREHAIRIPNGFSARLTQDRLQDQDLWLAIIKRQIKYFKINPETYVLCFYGRNVPGICTAWEHAKWDKAAYEKFHDLLAALSMAGFKVVYAPLTEPRIARDRDRAKILINQLIPVSGEPPEFMRLDLMLDKIDGDIGDDVIFDKISYRPQKEKTPSLKKALDRLQAQLKNIASKAQSQLDKVEKKQVERELTRLWLLYAATFFRSARPFNIFLSSPVFPPRWKFNLEGIDNDWDRQKDAQDWLREFQNGVDDSTGKSIPLFWSKPGGKYWLFRDASFSVRYILATFFARIEIRGLNTYIKVPSPAWIHYNIAQWYFRAYCTTDHTVPLCDVLYHLYQSIKLVSSARVEDETQDVNSQGYQRNLWTKAVTDLIKMLKLGRISLRLWMDREVAQSWFGSEVLGRVLKTVEAQRKFIFGSGTGTDLAAQAYSMELVHYLERTTQSYALLFEDQMSQGLRNDSDALMEADFVYYSRTPCPEKPGISQTHEMALFQEGAKWRNLESLKGPLADIVKKLQTNDEIHREFLTRECEATQRHEYDPDNEPMVVRSNHELFREVRTCMRRWIAPAELRPDFPQIIRTVISMTNKHIKRAYILENYRTLDVTRQVWNVIPSMPESRPIWGHVVILARLALQGCVYAPPSLINFELEERVEALTYLGLALGHLGRFFEAHRRLNEAEALLSKIPHRQNSYKRSMIELRRAEVHFLEAY